ncbi:rho guanine nucleotide exchange factor 25-like [Corticium candelabrum]|uniref:rho guanine nucleotide exchange factor 25-like n=1 Tax=Corticium candelabrum TaxID=121492 RepID=UPI002E275F18|nr:rho guanine nucleotide exchange factor 25-like [Corticium candelabrum]
MGGIYSKRKEIEGKLLGELPKDARFMLQELVDTEEKYVTDLTHLCKHHLVLYRDGKDVPTAIRGRERDLFGNIEGLMLFHRDIFLPKIRICLKEPAEVGACFADHVKDLNQYSQFFQDTAHQDEYFTDTTVKEFFQQITTRLNDVMNLQGFLMRPFQRLTRYRQLLEGLIKHMDSVLDEKGKENLNFALRLVKYQLRHSNDLRALALLKGFDGNLAEQGTLLLQEEFFVTDGKSNRKPRRVFLFDQTVIIAKPVGDMNAPFFKYIKVA